MLQVVEEAEVFQGRVEMIKINYKRKECENSSPPFIWSERFGGFDQSLDWIKRNFERSDIDFEWFKVFDDEKEIFHFSFLEEVEKIIERTKKNSAFE